MRTGDRTNPPDSCSYGKHWTSILGDSMYGPSKCPFKLQGQTLHAKVLGITHPSTGKYIEVDAPLPEYFNKLLKQLEER